MLNGEFLSIQWVINAKILENISWRRIKKSLTFIIIPWWIKRLNCIIESCKSFSIYWLPIKHYTCQLCWNYSALTEIKYCSYINIIIWVLVNRIIRNIIFWYKTGFQIKISWLSDNSTLLTLYINLASININLINLFSTWPFQKLVKNCNKFQYLSWSHHNFNTW